MGQAAGTKTAQRNAVPNSTFHIFSFVVWLFCLLSPTTDKPASKMWNVACGEEQLPGTVLTADLHQATIRSPAVLLLPGHFVFL